MLAATKPSTSKEGGFKPAPGFSPLSAAPRIFASGGDFHE